VLPLHAVHDLEHTGGRAVSPADEERTAIGEVAVEGQGLLQVNLEGREGGWEGGREGGREGGMDRI
jgi:hypothetical protein